MKCKYKEKGCNAPIPIKCSDYCIIKNLKMKIEELKEFNDWYDKAVRKLLEDKEKLKAELENYKIKYPIIDCYVCKNFQENKVLKAENEKLREKLHKHISKGYCECEFSKNLKAENEKLKEEVADLEDLAEFKEIRIRELQLLENNHKGILATHELTINQLKSENKQLLIRLSEKCGVYG